MISKEKIGLFGGTFDPVHVGHLIVAEWVLDALELQTVYFIPNLIHPFAKRANITSAEHRLSMLELAIKPFERFNVSDFELKKGGVSYAIDTIEHFEKRFPQARLFYFIGADNLPDFNKWHRYREILQKVQLVVYNRRNGFLPEFLSNEAILFLQTPLIEISSTLIRERIRMGKSVRSLLPYGVWDYIEREKLYRQD